MSRVRRLPRTLSCTAELSLDRVESLAIKSIARREKLVDRLLGIVELALHASLKGGCRWLAGWSAG